MKRIMVTILCMCLLLSGCQRNAGKGPDDGGNAYNEVQGNERDRDDINSVKLLKLNSEWTGIASADPVKPEFSIPDYKAEVLPYGIDADLSNIANINQFSGFTKEQTEAIAKNGFIVLPSRSTRMHYIYDTNEYRGIPNFITSDAVLHIYHQFYDKSLTSIETSYLYEDLDIMTDIMLQGSLILLGELKENELKVLQERNVVYFLIARMLMDSSGSASAVVKEFEDIRLLLSPEQLSLAEEEIALIEEASGIALSPYFGFGFDYSQFKVRGHYTRSEELQRFFKTMMWYGTAPLPLSNRQGEYDYANTHQALLMTYTAFLESGDTCAAKYWASIYQPTSEYVGLSDDIDLFTMNNLRKSVFGNSEDPNIFNDKEYSASLLEAVNALPEPKIQGKFAASDMPSQKQFRFMGQRYILDSFIMNNLTDAFLRPIPSPLDVMGVLGSGTAKDLLFQYYKPQEAWPEYETIYQKLYEEVMAYGIDTWSDNLYNGWVWSIQEALTEYDASSKMPYFMTTDAWKYKSLNAALGSYTELKHDTVLYGKQSGAECGGDIFSSKYHYVEPNIPLYSKLLYLTDNTVSVLNEQGMLNDELKEGAEGYQELLELLITCSIKELRNEMLTEDEYRDLVAFGGIMEWISQQFLAGVSGEGYTTWDLTDMLVTDIAYYGNSYLSLGTGYFDDIYVVVPVGEELYLARGSVYSYYEFISGTRLTDEEWWELQGIKISHETYYDYPEYIESSGDLPKQPFWTEEFKSDSNNVTITPLEVIWENMVE